MTDDHDLPDDATSDAFDQTDEWRTPDDRLDDLEAEVREMRQGIQGVAHMLGEFTRAMHPATHAIFGFLASLNEVISRPPVPEPEKEE